MKQHMLLTLCFTGALGAKVHSVQQSMEAEKASDEASTGMCSNWVTVGSTIALHNSMHNRFVRMTNGGVVDSNVAPLDGNGKPYLPASWTWERFEVVDAGNCQIGLYNNLHQRYLKLTSNDIVASPYAPIPMPPDYVEERMELVHLWDSYISLKRYGRMQMEPNGNMKAMYIENPGDYERFWVFEVESPLARLAGKVYIALHNQANNRYLKMTDAAGMEGSGQSSNLASSWTQERFWVVDAGNDEVALHSYDMNRFIRMNNGFMDASGHKNWWELPPASSWTWERFRVINGGTSSTGHGLIGLHNWAHNSFVQINDGGEAKTVGKNYWDLRHCPQCTWIKFVVIQVCHPASVNWIGKTVAIHNTFWNRFLRMTDNQFVVDGSGVSNANELPTSWSWERFTIVDAGWGQVAFHSPVHSRFLQDVENELKSTNQAPDFEIPADDRGKKRFLLLMDSNQFVLYSPAWQRYISLDQQTTSCHCCIGDYQRFTLVDAWHPLRGMVGQTVALYNEEWGRFVKSDGSLNVKASAPMSIQDLTAADTGALFYVTWEASEKVSFWNYQDRKFLFLEHDRLQLTPQAYQDKNNANPPSNAKLSVSDSGYHGQIALRCCYTNWIVQMKDNGQGSVEIFRATVAPENAGSWVRFIVVPMNVDIPPATFISHPGKICKDTPEPEKYTPYTFDPCDAGNCNGFTNQNIASCSMKCDESDIPPGCGQRMTCSAAVLHPDGRCHLYSTCPVDELIDRAGVTTLIPDPGASLLAFSNTTVASQNATVTTSKDFGPYGEVAVALPIVLINLSNFSGLIQPTGAGHVDIEHTFGDVDEDLELLYDKVAGFYGALHEVLGPDGPIYCPWNSYEHIEQCLMLASCLFQSHVPQHFSMSFYSSIAEQIERFDIAWQRLVDALGVETHNAERNFTIPGMGLPAKYQCGVHSVEESLIYPETTGTVLAQLNQDWSLASDTTLAMSRALEHASRSTQQILDSHSLNMSIDTTLRNLEEVWRPMCRKLKCDASNFADIFLNSHDITTALLQTGAAEHMRAHIRSRVQLERRLQLFEGEHAARFYRNEYPDASLQKAKQYGKKGRKAVHQLVLAFAAANEARAMRLVDQEELAKFMDEEETASPLDHGSISNQSLVSLTSLTAGMKTRGFLDFLRRAFECFGDFSTFVAEGYSRQIPCGVCAAPAYVCAVTFSPLAINLGLVGGADQSLLDLLEGHDPVGYFRAYVSFTLGAGAGNIWAGISASATWSMGCETRQVYLSIGVGVVFAVIIPGQYSACPLPNAVTRSICVPCGASFGFYYSIFCCKINLATGESNCR